MNIVKDPALPQHRSVVTPPDWNLQEDAEKYSLKHSKEKKRKAWNKTKTSGRKVPCTEVFTKVLAKPFAKLWQEEYLLRHAKHRRTAQKFLQKSLHRDTKVNNAQKYAGIFIFIEFVVVQRKLKSHFFTFLQIEILIGNIAKDPGPALPQHRSAAAPPY